MWRSSALALLLVAALAGAAGAQDLDNDTCLGCHGTEGFASDSGTPLYVGAETFAGSIHGSLPCTSCHSEITDVPHPESKTKIGAEACGTCHDDVLQSYARSVHGRARSNGMTEAATCTSCHGPPHALQRTSNPASPVYPLNLPRTCGTCHGDPDLARRHGIPVVNAYQLYMDSIHGRALTKSGLLVAANCSSCHGFHDIRPKSDPESKVYRTTIPSTCGSCHAGIKDVYLEGIHGQALQTGNPEAPMCADCHTAHQIARVDTRAWKLAIVTECGGCHAESLRTYRDTFHGQVTALGFTPIARCSDCHGSHAVFPASDPRSSVSPANLVGTCQKCHPRATASFARFAPHADPENRERNPGLYWVARLMNLLIVGVFAFFGIHTALWLVRSLLERAVRLANGSSGR